MSRPRPHAIRRSLLPLGIALACSLTPAHADVLYDSRSMAIDGSWNSARNTMIGGMAVYGFMVDQQVADDVTVADPVVLTRITADFWTPTSDGALPAGGWLVEVFPDVGAAPSETPARTVQGAPGTIVGSFAWTGGGGFSATSNVPLRRSTFEIDLTGRNVTLDAGTWWISVTAVDETPFGGRYLWIGKRPVPGQLGHVAHARDGGIAHGNPYDGTDSTPFTWIAMTTTSTVSNARPYEVSMRIEGNAATPSCPADFDGSGGAPDVADIFAFLSAWFASDPRADFDASGGAPDVGDIFAFLSAWFAGAGDPNCG